ncbi:MAG: 3-dehydroquinate synthase [Actinomycetota bacterium]|nr:3-dehydroquinate synthase [Actinomycetota bacterium]
MIALVGFMGAGKTTIGRILATRLGVPFVDVDALVEDRAGVSIRDLFDERGEGAFRALEAEVARAALGGREAVIALGGGALGDPTTVTALEWATVVHLDVSFREAMRRIGDTSSRPLLRDADPKGLYDLRRAGYERVADHAVAVDGKTPDEVAAEIAGLVGADAGEGSPRRIPVPIEGSSYDVLVGAGLLPRVGKLIPLPEDAEKVFVVTDPDVAAYAEHVASAFAEKGVERHKLVVPPGEASKSVASAAALLGELAARGAHRHDLVVGVGGGVVTDLAGFVASTYHRGMQVVHVPTTLLGQVDAAIGGKTAVNLPQGKNLVGTFHQPRAVVCDVETLHTLPRAELVSGMAEVVKYGLISEPGMLDVVTGRAAEILAADESILTELVTRSVAIKAAIVARDERDKGPRAHLNYGHTFGHAIEHVSARKGAPFRHGEAVALGMMAAAFTAHELGRIDESDVAAHRRALQAVGLPVEAPLDLGDLEEAWQHDKKYRRGVRFVLLSDLGRPEAGVEVGRDVLSRAVRRMSG